MPVLDEEYIGSSCVIKSENNDLLTMGTLHKIKPSYIDISNARNELPEIPYNLQVKVEIYNSQQGFRVLGGMVYISSNKLLRIINVREAAGDERREYFRINVREPAYLYDENADEIQVDLVDISLGGLLFKCKREFAVDEYLTIRIPVIEHTVPFHCVVRRHVDFDRGYFGHGCEFMELTMIQEDLLYKFMLKKQNDQLKRVR